MVTDTKTEDFIRPRRSLHLNLYEESVGGEGQGGREGLLPVDI